MVLVLTLTSLAACLSETGLVAVGEGVLVLSQQKEDHFSACHLNKRQGIADDGVVDNFVIVKRTAGHWSQGAVDASTGRTNLEDGDTFDE